VTLVTPLALVTKVVIPVDVDEDELSEPPPPQEMSIAADPSNKLNTRPVLVNILEQTVLHVALNIFLNLNFISIPWGLCLFVKFIFYLDRFRLFLSP
jgi:hypothetical protein